MKIDNLLKRRISELSGGQLKKVLLARALCCNPKVLVLDEPCASLDENSSAEFYNILEKLNKLNKITILMVVHDIKYAKNISKKVINITNGVVTIIANNIN